MKHREDFDTIGARVAPDDTGTLFDKPDLPSWATKYTKAHRLADIARLVPLAIEIAARNQEHGYTVSDVRITAVQRGLLTGQEEGRRLSFLHAVPRAAGHIPTGEYRRSDVAKAHGNLNKVHCDPRYIKLRKTA